MLRQALETGFTTFISHTAIVNAALLNAYGPAFTALLRRIRTSAKTYRYSTLPSITSSAVMPTMVESEILAAETALAKVQDGWTYGSVDGHAALHRLERELQALTDAAVGGKS